MRAATELPELAPEQTPDLAAMPALKNPLSARGESPEKKRGALQEQPASFLRDTMEIFKLRVTLMVVLTAWAGYHLGSVQSGINSFNWTMLDTLLGVALVSCGASVMNQVFERRSDAMMLRTARRPLATGRLGLAYGVLLGMTTIAGGSIWLAYWTNPVTGILTLLTAVTYVGIYTPLKRHSTLATFIGAFPGAMPPLIGWTAARGAIEWPAVALFAILFVWQFPHFMAIGWLYREDYGRAKIQMLPVVEPDGWSTAMEALIYAVMMVPVSLLPYFLHIEGRVYLISATILSLGYLLYTVRFFRIAYTSDANQSRRDARALLKASVIYLPLLLAVMMLNAQRKELLP